MRSVRLPDQIEQDLEAIASEKNVSKSEIIKEALKKYIDTFKKFDNSFEAGEQLFGKYGSHENDRSVTYKSRIRSKVREKHTR